MREDKAKAILCALLSAALFGASIPLSKLLLGSLPPLLLAALLYLGAGAGTFLLETLRGRLSRAPAETALTRKDVPCLAAVIALDAAAPILILLGLSRADPGAASLLSNFEIVATALLAASLFKEAVGGRMWAAIGFITFASVLLSCEDIGRFRFSAPALLILAATVCWGMENNLTRVLSEKNPFQIVVVKGLGSGGVALAIAFSAGAARGTLPAILLALLLGFCSYGMSIALYIYAQRGLGAARTGTIYAIAPFVGYALSLAVFGWQGGGLAVPATAAMAVGAVLACLEKHTHPHRHGALVHTHPHYAGLFHRHRHVRHTNENGG
ncbi:MAG: DMT family transporter [Clostridiales Family XIII bacterium]|jgi:drug/metabolite transporter (DMT)-like permease|nr:DMT family transporter [Clostridiales Family XIII bacterium]